MSKSLRKIGRFLGKHSGELETIGETLKLLLAFAPVPQHEKAALAEKIERFSTAAENIAEAGAAIVAEADALLTKPEKAKPAPAPAAIKTVGDKPAAPGRIQA